MIISKPHSRSVMRLFAGQKFTIYERSVAALLKTSLLLAIILLSVSCNGRNDNSYYSDDGVNIDVNNTDQEFDNALLEEDNSLVPPILSLTVEDFSVGNNGVSIPGVPAWFTLKKKKNLAICLTTMTGSTACHPDINLSRSLCPKTERCTYENVATGGEPFVVTVFNINNLGQRMIKRALEFQCDNLGELRSDRCDDMHNYIADANKRRAIWLGSFIISSRDLTMKEKENLQNYSRTDILSRIFPGSENTETGALSAPFEVCVGDQYIGWECDPLREISVKAEFRE